MASLSPCCVPLSLSSRGLHPERAEERSLHQAGGKEGRGDWVTGDLLPAMLAGPVETAGEATQRPLQSHYVGARGEMQAPEALGFLRILSWVSHFGRRLYQR